MKVNTFMLSIALLFACQYVLGQVQTQTFTCNVASSYLMKLGQRDTTPGQLTIGTTEIIWRDFSGAVQDSLSIVARFGTVSDVKGDWVVKYYVRCSLGSGEGSLRKSNGVVGFTYIPSDQSKVLDGFELALSNVTMN
jgi:hypothetical protein